MQSIAMKLLAALSLVALLLLQARADAASFACAKAGSKIEKMICADATLSRLDEQLAAAYRKAATDWDTTYNGQREWLRDTRDRCASAACLKKAYAARIDVLEHWHEPVAWSDADMQGMYVERRRFSVFSGKEDWRPAEGDDCLSLAPAKAGSGIELHVDSTQSNGHSCSIDILVRRDGEGIVTVPGADDLNKTCAMHIRAERGALVIHDPDQTCKDYHCGMRASFDGLSFRRDQRKPGRCPDVY